VITLDWNVIHQDASVGCPRQKAANLIAKGANMKTITKGIIAVAMSIGVSGTSVAAEESKKTFNITPNTALTFYGFVRVEAFYDFDREQGDLSQAGGLAGLAETSGTFETSVRVSRFGFRLAQESDIGTINGQLEYDLFGSGGDAELRLRHANVQWNNWTVGQTWTNFMPLSHYPTSLDFNGPVGIAFARVPQIRYSGVSGDLDYSFSLEESQGASRDPVVTAAAQYNGENYSLRLAGLAGTLESGNDDIDRNGITASGSFQPWKGGSFGATFVSGEGLGDLLIGGGASIDTGDAVDVDGYTLEYRQDIGEKWNVGIAYGNEDYDAGALSEVESLHINAIYSPVDNLSIGFEYIRGEATDNAGTTVEADRIGTSITFRF
jgi:hypothetical protein